MRIIPNESLGALGCYQQQFALQTLLDGMRNTKSSTKDSLEQYSNLTNSINQSMLQHFPTVESKMT